MSTADTPTQRVMAAAILRDPPSPFNGQFVRVEFALQLAHELEEEREHNAAPQAASTLAKVEVPESDREAKVSGKPAVAAPVCGVATPTAEEWLQRAIAGLLALQNLFIDDGYKWDSTLIGGLETTLSQINEATILLQSATGELLTRPKK